MVLKIDAIDHIHINVVDRRRSQAWYRDVLGLVPVPQLLFWTEEGGPLTLTDADGNIHLALFESRNVQNTTVALRVSAQDFVQWLSHLKANGLDVQPVDHQVSWSVYFRDPDGNPFEITTYEYTNCPGKTVVEIGEDKHA